MTLSTEQTQYIKNFLAGTKEIEDRATRRELLLITCAGALKGCRDNTRDFRAKAVFQMIISAIDAEVYGAQPSHQPTREGT